LQEDKVRIKRLKALDYIFSLKFIQKRFRAHMMRKAGKSIGYGQVEKIHCNELRYRLNLFSMANLKPAESKSKYIVAKFVNHIGSKIEMNAKME